MSLYKDRLAAGKCGTAGCPNPKPNDGSLCPVCREKAKAKQAAKREARLTAGICVDCPKSDPKKAVDGVRCEEHRQYQEKKRKEAAAKKKLAGICVQTGCHELAKEGCTLCQAHIDKMTEVSTKRYYNNKEQGWCRHCGPNVLPANPDGALCADCLAKDHEYKLKLKLEVIAKYGGAKCSYPGCTCIDLEILEIDHIDGGGRKHLKREHIGSGNGFYHWLRRNNYPKGFRVLCPTHNKKAYHDKRKGREEADVQGGEEAQQSMAGCPESGGDPR